jgi:hypothetical protein
MTEETPNTTDVDDCCTRLTENDSTLTEVNVNNMKHISRERIKALIDCAKKSHSLQKLSLCNTAITDKEAEVSGRT